MTISGTLDRIFALPTVQRRNLRWWPLVALVTLAAGYSLFVNPGGAPKVGLLGAMLFALAYGSSFYFRYFGPRIYDGIGAPLDERERDLRHRAGHMAGTVITIATITACFYFGVAPVFHLWMPRQVHEWTLLGMSVQATWFILPTLVASWLQKPVRD